MTDLIYMGSAVKALGNGKVAGYLVTFSDQTQPDLSRERDFFTAECDFDLDTGNRKSVFYSHGLDTKMGVKRIGIGDVKQDEVGVWIEAQLNVRDEYEKAIYKMAEDGKLGWSSGAPSHLVTRKAIETDSGTVHEIKTWPLAEASLTPCPADHRNQAIAFKSLPAMIEAEPTGDATKTLPSDWTYRDLIRFLESELNEDFGRQGSCDPWDSYSPSLYYWVENLKENPDAVIYHRSDEPGDTFSRPYTVTNNDAEWGDEQEVIETTTYVNAPNDDAAPMMAGKQADVTALKQMLRDSMTFGDHADIATSAMEGFVTRAAALSEMSTKAGRVISGANRDKLKRIHAGMTTAHTAMEGHLEAINTMLLSTDPDAKKEAEEVAALRMDFLRRQARTLGIAV